MNTKKAAVLGLVACLLLLTSAATLSAEEFQSWFVNQINLDITDELDMQFNWDARHLQLTLLDDAFLKNLGIGLNYKLPFGFRVGLGYMLEELNRTETYKEWRFHGEAAWHIILFGLARIDAAYRYENRTFAETSGGREAYARHRIKGMLTFLVRLWHLPLKPYGELEFFSSSGDNTDNGKMRMGFGIKLPLRSTVVLDICFLVDEAESDQKLNILRTGFALSF